MERSGASQGHCPSVIIISDNTTERPLSSLAVSVLGLFCQRRLASCYSWKQHEGKVRFVFLFLLPWPVYIFVGILFSFLPPLLFPSFSPPFLSPFHLPSFPPSLLPPITRKSVSKPENDLIVKDAASQSDMSHYEGDFKGQKWPPLLHHSL